ncbi:MAG: DUF2285 domain-containing protein [Boseongicola sp.]|nr:DUF2285 domain-containing protein [Boseongicola sp.]
MERLLTVMDGLAAGRSARGIATDVWGEEAVAREWSADGWMRSQVRRWIAKARALADDGWRDLLPGRAPEG